MFDRLTFHSLSGLGDLLWHGAVALMRVEVVEVGDNIPNSRQFLVPSHPANANISSLVRENWLPQVSNPMSFPMEGFSCLESSRIGLKHEGLLFFSEFFHKREGLLFSNHKLSNEFIIIHFSELSLTEYKNVSPMFGEDVYSITVESSLAARDVTGGTAPKQVELALATARKIIGESKRGK